MKRLSLLTLLTFVTIKIVAYDFIYDGIPYNILSVSDKTVEVAYSYNSYTGQIIVPSEVKYESVTFKVIALGNEAFAFNPKITSVILPETIKQLKFRSFHHCDALESVNIPNGVVSIESEAFNLCGNLKSIEFPESVLKIESFALKECKSLTIVNLPNSVTSIGSYAFEGCENLSEVSIPNSLKSIGNYAFRDCHALKLIVSKILNPYNCKMGDNVFSGTTYWGATLSVPHGTVNLYKSANGWKDFFYMEEANGYGIYKMTYLVDGQTYKTLDVECGANITPEALPTREGYTFSGWSEIPGTMPAKDVTVTGTFTVNKYKLTYQVDGTEYKTNEVEYGATITPEAFPTKEGYTFSGWSEIPETMPAKDVTVVGTFTVNKYKLTYMIGNEVYKVVEYDYGATITPEGKPEGDYVTFVWKDVPETMPAKDVTVYADYETGIAEVLMAKDIKYIYAPNGKRIEKLQKGLNIVVMNDGTVRKVVMK